MIHFSTLAKDSVTAALVTLSSNYYKYKRQPYIGSWWTTATVYALKRTEELLKLDASVSNCESPHPPLWYHMWHRVNETSTLKDSTSFSLLSDLIIDWNERDTYITCCLPPLQHQTSHRPSKQVWALLLLHVEYCVYAIWHTSCCHACACECVLVMG